MWQGREDNKRPIVLVRNGIYIQSANGKKERSPSKGAKKIYLNLPGTVQGDGAKWVQWRGCSVEPGDGHRAEEDHCVHEGVTKAGGPAWTPCLILHKLVQLRRA